MQPINIFVDPKHLKNWSIQLANCLGGQEVSKGAILTKLDTKKVDILIEKFVSDYNDSLKTINEEE